MVWFFAPNNQKLQYLPGTNRRGRICATFRCGCQGQSWFLVSWENRKHAWDLKAKYTSCWMSCWWLDNWTTQEKDMPRESTMGEDKQVREKCGVRCASVGLVHTALKCINAHDTTMLLYIGGNHGVVASEEQWIPSRLHTRRQHLRQPTTNMPCGCGGEWQRLVFLFCLSSLCYYWLTSPRLSLVWQVFALCWRHANSRCTHVHHEEIFSYEYIR